MSGAEAPAVRSGPDHQGDAPILRGITGPFLAPGANLVTTDKGSTWRFLDDELADARRAAARRRADMAPPEGGTQLRLRVRGPEVELAATDEPDVLALVAAELGGSARPVERLRDRLRGRATRTAVRPGDGAGPPRYLVELADAAGLDVREHGWAMLAPGRYRSKKVVFLLLPPGHRAPSLVCKLTRDAAANDRLRAEWEALRTVAALPAISAPQPVLRGEVAGLAAIGLSYVEGRPLSRVAPDRADAQSRALLAVADLGLVPAGPAVDAAMVAELLDGMIDVYDRTYRPTAELMRCLHHHAEVVARSGTRVPTVLQHGDPGAWNILVDDEDRPILLDWESWDPRGVPLWDLFHLARSLAVRVAGAAGRRDRLAALDRQLREGSPVLRRAGREVARAADEVGLDPTLRLPLLHLCWVHRALKEASRLQPRRLASGHYHQLVQLTAERLSAPGVDLLLGAEARRRR